MTQNRLHSTLKAYLWATKAVPWIAPALLRRRLKAGKELPGRWQEKLGQATHPRPSGRLIWLHGVGLGEVLALRGLVAAMTDLDPHLSFLLTSTTASSAKALEKQLPPRSQHQFLPLDAPGFVAPFLDHWQPDMAIWTDQDLWPGLALAVHSRGIPQAIVAGRITEASYEKRRRYKGGYADLYTRFNLIAAQDAASQSRFAALGAKDVQLRGSLKPASPPLTCDMDVLARIKAAIGNRYVWIVAPSHAADEEIALTAHKIVRQSRPDALLIVAPRFVHRTVATDMANVRWSHGTLPSAENAVLVADTTGDLGLWYRLAQAALIGGTYDATEGHNPWEAIILDVPVFHGPRVSNFVQDYTMLDAAQAAMEVTDPTQLAACLAGDVAKQRQNAQQLLAQARSGVAALASDLLQLGIKT